ncbi:hypothetical protein FNV43_RR19128 [Rhamnella rubrinervis]|uniref:Uncharacterized protein n=1 Tax=Rhamnella rubrinervis TaxID=2594499 RepID=A0A8K0EBW7_9ROSA|nr:hypothetical protein FNV43_RR19128 [Rhamnella rubrinervis]
MSRNTIKVLETLRLRALRVARARFYVPKAIGTGNCMPKGTCTQEDGDPELYEPRDRTLDYASPLQALSSGLLFTRELKEKVRYVDTEVKLKDETIQKLQDTLSTSKARIKELKVDVIKSEEVNKKNVKKLKGIMTQLEEKSVKAIQELESLKYLTNKTVETEGAQQLNACLSQIDHKYPDLDLSCVCEDDTVRR